MFKGLRVSPRLSVAIIIVATLLGTALVSPLYPIFQDQWGLDTSAITQIYVVYMLGALFGLLCLGRLGDRMGYVATLWCALILALSGSLLCIMANGLPLLFFGRFLVGIAGTMATAAGSAGLNLLTPEAERPRIGLKISLLVTAGFGLGPVIGGIVGQWVLNPLVMVHMPTLILLIIGLFLIRGLAPRGTLVQSLRRLEWADVMPKLTWPKAGMGSVFAIASLLPFITFGIFGLYSAMAPSLMRQVLGLSGPLASGLGIAAILSGAAVTQIMVRRANERHAAMTGLALLAASNIILVANLTLGHVPLFFVGLVLTSLGHGACMFAGIQVVNRLSDETNRASITASFWAIGYCGSILPMLATGYMSDAWGLTVAVTVFCLFNAGLSFLALILFGSLGRRVEPQVCQS